MASACSESDMPTDSSVVMSDPIDGAVMPFDVIDSAEPVAVNSVDVQDFDDTTKPVDEPASDQTEPEVSIDTPDSLVPVVDPDGTNIPGDDPDTGTISPEEHADTPNEPINDPNANIPAPVHLSIARALLDSPDYQTLLTLIQQVDLTLALDGDNDGNGWTLFAFSDTAYENENFMTVTDEQTEALVRRHIFPGRLAFSDINPGLLGMTQGLVDVVQNSDGTLTIGGARVVARDRVFSNGTIHFVDSVLDEF